MDSRKYNEKDVTASLDGIAEAIKSGGLAPSVIADPYSDEATYSVGDYVTFNAKSYRCVTAIDTPEEFDSEKWDEIKVLDELASAVELPPVTSTDNGKILKVTEGVWAKGDAPSGGGETFHIVYTENSGSTTADKTSAELLAAIEAGKTITCDMIIERSQTTVIENVPLSSYSIVHDVFEETPTVSLRYTFGFFKIMSDRGGLNGYQVDGSYECLMSNPIEEYEEISIYMSDYDSSR